MRIALIGANGQLAQDLAPVLEESGHQVTGLTHAQTRLPEPCGGQVEVADLDSVRAALVPMRPELVINTSAYHKVDEVEENPGKAFAVNAVGPRNLALACRDMDAVLVHMSTDYVFSGRKGTPYVEDDPVDPVNIYGVSKAAGEMIIRYLWPKHFIVRVSGLYGKAGSSGKGGNFVETMLRLAREGKPIKVVNDQTLTPTSTVAAARQIAVLIATDAYGIYHATCQGECTWYEFAAEIFRAAGVEVDLSPQTTAQSGAIAIRPTYSVLWNQRLKMLGKDVMPAWQDALMSYLADRRA